MIIGNKTIIRPFEDGDEVILHKWWNDGDMMGDSGLAYGTLQSLEFIKGKVEVELQNGNFYDRDKKCFIICKKENLKPIGEINYNCYDARNQKSEFGIKICEICEQGKGYGEDALSFFIEFMFKNLNLNKIELTTMIDNKRAQNLYKKLGFKEIGIIRQSYFDSRCGEFSDVVYMDLLKSEWIKMKPKFILVSDNIRLISLDNSQWKIALPWYQDKDILYFSEGVTDKVYSLDTIYRMYKYLESTGELYFIQILENGNYKTIGDVAISKNNMPIVIGDKNYWGKGIGKKVILKLLERGKQLEFKSIYVPKIYLYNKRSTNLFESVGFQQISENGQYKSYEKVL